MSITLEQFAHECHVLLKKNPNPIGRQQVADLLSTLLTDRQFIDLHINDTVGERKIIYEDSDLGFCILLLHPSFCIFEDQIRSDLCNDMFSFPTK